MNRTAIFMILFALLFAGCASTNLQPLSATNDPLEEDEGRLWNRAEEEERKIDRSGAIYEDAELDAYLDSIAKKLHCPAAHERIDFRIAVVENPLLNAFAMPNGRIYLHTGILARIENEAQLATLLGHEMAHSINRHAILQRRGLKNNTAFLATLGSTVGGMGAMGSFVTLLGALGTVAAVTGYSKELEAEADLEGFRAMVAAGYDSREAPKLFAHLKNELEEDDRDEPFFFGTHPRLKERISSFSRLLTEKMAGGTGVTNAEVYFEKTRNLILDNARYDLAAGRFKSVEKTLKRFLAMDSGNPTAYCILAEMHCQQADENAPEIAEKYYRTALDLDPDHAEAHAGLGRLYYKRGNLVEAGSHFTRYLEIEPGAADRDYVVNYLKRCGGGSEP